jgi:hypothetical protein
MTESTADCPKHVRAGRFRKAEQFHQVAQDVLALADDNHDVGDSFVTLCVHAGIAAADVICCAALGKHATGENHNRAVALLRQTDKAAANHLKTLLDMKTKAAYTALASSGDEIKKATRAVEALVDAARQAHASAG